MNKPITEYTIDELKDIFASVVTWDNQGAALSGYAEVTRAIIRNELAFPSDDCQRDLRDIWYSSVKPTFDKLGFLIRPETCTVSDTAFMKGRNDLLEGQLAAMVKDGEISYSDLNILDHSREREAAARYTGYIENMPKYFVSFGQFPWIVLATEKDTQYAELLEIAQLYGCSCISGKGQCSLAAMEDLFNQIKDSSETVVFLSFTDYDGAGYSIAETFAEQMRVFVKNNPCTIKDVVSNRLGLDLSQMEPDEIQANKYRLTENAVNNKWVSKTGGVDGEPYGVELNALKHRKRRQIIAEGIEQYINTDEIKKYMAHEYCKKVILEEFASTLNIALNNACDEHAKKIDVPKFNMIDLAIDGQTTLPLDACSPDHNEDLISSFVEYLKGQL